MYGRCSGIGLDIGSSGIRLVQLKKYRKNYRLLAYAEVKTPENALENGIITDVEAIAVAVDRVYRQAGVRTRRVVASIPGQQAWVRCLTLPRFNRRELRRAALYQAAALLPFSVDELVADTIICAADKVSHQVEVLVVAARKQVVGALVECLRMVDIIPEAVEIAPVSLYRALRTDGVTGNLLVVDIGSTGMRLSLFCKGVLRCTKSVAPSLPLFNRLPAAGKGAAGVGVAAQRFLPLLVKEIVLTMEESGIRRDRPGVGPIVLTGKGAATEGLVELLQDNLAQPVLLGDPLARLSLTGDCPVQEVERLRFRYAVAIGAAAREVVR